MKKILILGGTHGNEALGIELVKLLEARPLSGVSALLANPKAVSRNTRYTQSDLNRSFGNDYPDTYETARARELKRMCQDYELVLDFHDTQAPNNNCAFVGIYCQSELFAAAKRLGLIQCVEATYD